MNGQFKHDCDRCVLVHRTKDLDLYVCPTRKGGRTISTVIARYGDVAPDYASGLEPALIGSQEPDSRAGWMNHALFCALSDGWKVPGKLYGKLYTSAHGHKGRVVLVSSAVTKESVTTYDGLGRVTRTYR